MLSIEGFSYSVHGLSVDVEITNAKFKDGVWTVCVEDVAKGYGTTLRDALEDLDNRLRRIFGLFENGLDVATKRAKDNVSKSR